MSHELLFLPRLLGQSWAQALDAAADASVLQDPAVTAHRLDAWDRLVARAAALLGPGASYRGRRHGEFVHHATRTRVAYHGDDGLLSIPYWLDDRAAIDLFGRIPAFTRAVHDETGLEAFCPRRGRAVGELTVTELVADYRVCRMETADLLGPGAGAGTITGAGRVAYLPPARPARPAAADVDAGWLPPPPPPAEPPPPPTVPPVAAPQAVEPPAAAVTGPPRPSAAVAGVPGGPATWDVPPAPPAPVMAGTVEPAVAELPPPWPVLPRPQAVAPRPLAAQQDAAPPS